VPTELGDLLAEVRAKKGLSLREVEAATGISNAHLYQIENGDIERPAIGILWKLANFYALNFNRLMRLAGHVQPKGTTSRQRSLAATALHAVDDLSPREEKELLEFMEALRKRRTTKEK
jgi:HTH-type transcriptional regulator, competence development regulator